MEGQIEVPFVKKEYSARPVEQDCESEKTEKQEPQGWLEKHLDFLLTIYNRSITTHGKVLRLEKEIKTNKVGQ